MRVTLQQDGDQNIYAEIPTLEHRVSSCDLDTATTRAMLAEIASRTMICWESGLYLPG